MLGRLAIGGALRGGSAVLAGRRGTVGLRGRAVRLLRGRMLSVLLVLGRGLLSVLLVLGRGLLSRVPRRERGRLPLGRVAAMLGRAARRRILAGRRLAVVASLGRRWLLLVLPLALRRIVLALLAVGRLAVALIRHSWTCFVLCRRSSSRIDPKEGCAFIVAYLPRLSLYRCRCCVLGKSSQGIVCVPCKMRIKLGAGDT